jgi:hypothetical protein
MPNFIDIVEVGPRGIQGPIGPSNEAGRSFLLDEDPTVGCVMTRDPERGPLSTMTWTSTETGLAMKRITISRIAGAVSTIVTQALDPGNGVTVIAQKTERIVRGGDVPSITITREI